MKIEIMTTKSKMEVVKTLQVRGPPTRHMSHSSSPIRPPRLDRPPREPPPTRSPGPRDPAFPTISFPSTLPLFLSLSAAQYAIDQLIKAVLPPAACEVRQHADAGRPAPLALRLAYQHQAIAGPVPVMAPVAAAVLDGQRGRDLLAVIADDASERPELLLLLRGHPALDDDVLGILDLGEKGVVVSTCSEKLGQQVGTGLWSGAGGDGQKHLPNRPPTRWPSPAAPRSRGASAPYACTSSWSW